MPKLTALIVLVGLLAAPSADALVNGEAPAEDDTRFDAVAAFSRTAWLTPTEDNKHENNWFGAGVLIAPDVVLVAKHLLPPPVSSGKAQAKNKFMVRFRRHADGTLGSKQQGPASYHQVPVAKWVMIDKADLALGVLAKPVQHIEPVRVLLDTEVELDKARCVLAGWGSESPWQGVKLPRIGLKVGENTVSQYPRDPRILLIDHYKTERRQTEQGDTRAYVVSEQAAPNMHDSGGSVFIFDDEGRPVLAALISSYTAGPYLAYVASQGAPLEAATRGGKALIAAVEGK